MRTPISIGMRSPRAVSLCSSRTRRGPMCVLLVAIWIQIRLVEEPFLLHVHGRPRRRRASSSKPRPVPSRRCTRSRRAGDRPASAQPSPRRAAGGGDSGVSSDPAGCRLRCERAAPAHRRREDVLLPARRLVGARAFAPCWWAVVRRPWPWPCTSRSAGGRTEPVLADRSGAWWTRGWGGNGLRWPVCRAARCQPRASRRPLSVLGGV